MRVKLLLVAASIVLGAYAQGDEWPVYGRVFIAATLDARFRAFDSRTGKELWKGEATDTVIAFRLE
jgi:glucose dehydrogenase